jgi:hypothetical protein
MPRNQGRVDVIPYEPELAWRRAGDAVENISREDALHLACTLCDAGTCGWVRKAHLAREGALVAKCFGRFDLHNPERPDLPWPAIVFGVRQKSGPSQALLMLYYGIDPRHPNKLCWQVNDEGPTDLPNGGRGIFVDVRRYTGNPKGPKGVVNGDDAGGPAVILGRPPSIPEPPPPPLQPSETAASPQRSRSRAGAEVRRQARKCKPPAVEVARPSTQTPDSGTPSVQPSAKMELVLRLLRLLQDG